MGVTTQPYSYLKKTVYLTAIQATHIWMIATAYPSPKPDTGLADFRK